MALYPFSHTKTVQALKELLCESTMGNNAFSPFYTGVCLFICLLKELRLKHLKSYWLHMFGSSLLCVFKGFLKLPALEDEKSHWLHLFNFSPLCLFKCVLKLPAREEA